MYSAYNANAAARTPAAPPTNAMAPVGMAPEAAPAVLGDPDTEADAAAVSLAPDPDAVFVASPAAALVMETVWIALMDLTSLALRTSIEMPGRSTWAPVCVTVHVMSAAAISPFQLHEASMVNCPGVGSVMWNSHVSEPCLSV
jgi:hypothetical protein